MKKINNEYVLVYAEVPTGIPLIKNDNACVEASYPQRPILVILKDRPDWQRGRINFPGGKVELGESPEESAVRELKEETGLEAVSSPIKIGEIIGSWGIVHCFNAQISTIQLSPRPNETEKVFWDSWQKLKDDKRLIPNLRVVIPLMMAGAANWSIEDEGPAWRSDRHTIKITIDSDKKEV